MTVVASGRVGALVMRQSLGDYCRVERACKLAARFSINKGYPPVKRVTKSRLLRSAETRRLLALLLFVFFVRLLVFLLSAYVAFLFLNDPRLLLACL